MGCEFSQPFELAFLESNFVARPLETDVRERSGAFTVGTFTFSDDAGQYIADTAKQYEPVLMRADGVDMFRFMVPEEPVEFRRMFGDRDRARVTLLDPLQILQRGSLSHEWMVGEYEVELSTLINYILDNRLDEYGVISGGPTYLGTESASTVLQAPQFSPIRLLQDALRALGIDDTETVDAFSIDGDTPLEALSKVADVFETGAFIRNDGTFVVGARPLDGDTIVAGRDAKLSRFDVSRSGTNITTVRVIGAYNEQYKSVTDGVRIDGLSPVAEASAGDSGGTLVLETKSKRSLEELATLAKRALAYEIMSSTNGSAAINALASSSTAALGDLHVGDYLTVPPEINEHCARERIDGTFVIESVIHNVDPRQGWMINVDLAMTPDVSSLSTQTFWYDPNTNQSFESLKSYNEYRDSQ